MKESDLSEEVHNLISTSIPSIDALEILILLVRDPNRSWTALEIAGTIRPPGMTSVAVRQYLALLHTQGLASESPDAGFAYFPSDSEKAAAVRGLARAYDERPVTLIRTVYAIADRKSIQAFADAFKIRKDDK